MKVGDELICKKTLSGDYNIKKHKKYKICSIGKVTVSIDNARKPGSIWKTPPNFPVRFLLDRVSSPVRIAYPESIEWLYIWDYFYTKKEIREFKLNKINERG